MQLPDSHNFLSVRPGLTVRHARRGSQGKTEAEASLDLKWRPRAELVIDGTLNPDFSQVVLDVPQRAGNTRFALSLAEKRPFFFESTDLLRTPRSATALARTSAPGCVRCARWSSSRASTWPGSTATASAATAKAQQWLAVWHFDARHNLRAIVQRSVLDRRAEPGVAAEQSLSRSESLTYAWRHSAGTRLYVGVTRSRQGRLESASNIEAFIKLELDAEDLRALAS